MTLADLIAYYVSLLIMQYYTQPNASAMMTLFVGEFLQNQIVQQIMDGFSVPTAVGVQLDMLGAYRGITRQIYGFNPGYVYWTFPTYSTASPGALGGWNTYGAAATGVLWLQYPDLDNLVYTLNDNDFRTYLQWKIAVDAWPGNLAAIDNMLYTFFGTYVTFVDNENMTIEYHQDPAHPSNLFATLEVTGKVPRPAGVGVTITSP